MSWLGIPVFVATYALISVRRMKCLGLDRPAAALVGAVLCVVLGVLTPGEAAGSVNGPTLLLLFGVMGMGAFLSLDGFFDRAEAAVMRVAKTPARLLGCLVWGAGILSALITNDAVCVLGAPLVVRIVQRHKLPALPYLLALATAANTGSVATLVGNPQNMLCATLGHLSYAEHLLRVGPLALVCLGVNHGLLWLFFRRRLPSGRLEMQPSNPAMPMRGAITMAVIAATSVAYIAGANMPWTATTGFVALILIHRRDTRLLWPRIDWSLLLFFAGLFVVVEGFMRSGGPAWLFAHVPLAAPKGHGLLAWLRVAGVFLLGSNIVSNVPFILVIRAQMASLPDPTLGWELLAVTSTFAGNLTLLGSVANIIVAESARDVGGVGFVDFLKVGVPLAVSTTLLGVLWLYAFFPG